MCGIIGIVGQRQVAQLLVDGLKHLEYRGYDSAGIATIEKNRILRRRAKGKLVNLQKLINEDPVSGTIGIGHTRWATHGKPDTRNAHPHSNGKVAVVHNGIIENHKELRQELLDKGILFDTDTDTEVVVHLITMEIEKGLSPAKAVSRVLKRLKGAFALGVIFIAEDDLLIATRRGSPLAIGYGEGEMYIGSDAIALVHLTNKVCYLCEGDYCLISHREARIYNDRDQPVERPLTRSDLDSAMIGKGHYRHYMLKEIHEQPAAIGETFLASLDPAQDSIDFSRTGLDPGKISNLHIVACGTAYYAGCIARYWFEELAGLRVNVDVASEFRYRNTPLTSNETALFISQSGETIDTIEALNHSKKSGLALVSIVNALESSIARKSDIVLHTLAGPEIGVASTKAFTTQLTLLACLAIATARAKGRLDEKQSCELISCLRKLPTLFVSVLNRKDEILPLAQILARARNVLYMGRNLMAPLSFEGALKLKEISYIHAEGYAAGELKHGPIALIDEEMPIVVSAPGNNSALFEKTASNVEEVVARGGQVILLSDAKGIEELGAKVAAFFEMPSIDFFAAPILYSLPIQLLAYYTALEKGTDVDQPRNLAKSVTVE